MSRESIAKFCTPMLVLNWIFGIGIIEYPPGHQHFVISLLYSAFSVIAYCYLSWYSYPHLLQMTWELKVNNNVIKVLFYSHVCIVIVSVVTGWSRNQGIRSIIKQSVNLDSLLEQIGIPKMYKIKFKMQLLKHGCGFLFILAIVSINLLVMLLNRATIDNDNITTVIVINYPIIMIFVADYTFVNLVKLTTENIKTLNMTLRTLITSTEDCPQHAQIIKLCWALENERSRDHQLDDIKEDITFKLNTAKKIHLHLLKVYKEINETFDLHLLLSIVNTIGVMTVCLYQIDEYALDTFKLSESELVRNALHSFFWIFVYGIKIFITCYTCTNAVGESVVTGDIISEIYDEPFIGKEAQAQIRDFQFNLMQDVSFTAKGFVKIDLTLIQVVIGSITTYVMILSQFKNVIVPVCTNSTCS